MKISIALLLSLLVLTSCSGFKAERVGSEESDEKAMEITDNWMSKDTVLAMKDVMKQMKKHQGYKRYIAKYVGTPKVFTAEIQNQTSEAYFPIGDMNDEFLNELSQMGEFILVDEQARSKILKEITYQNDGMVDPNSAKQVGKQIGADLMIFGTVYMKPEKRDGKTVKEYSVNIRMTDIEKGVEVFRTRTHIYKYSDQSATKL